MNSHNAVPNIFDLYIPRYASTIVSYQRSEASLNIAHPHDDTSPHASTREDAAADDAIPVVDRTLGGLFRLGAEEEIVPALGPHPIADSAEEAGIGLEGAARAQVAVAKIDP